MHVIGFVGLGVMGAPMARCLLKEGFRVQAYNRTRAKAQAWADTLGDLSENLSLVDTPAAAAGACDALVTCVGNDDDLRSVTLGDDGILSGLGDGGLFVDHSTVSADVAVEINTLCENRSIDFMDAPISGGEAGAINGVLTIMCGGTDAAFERAKPVLSAYGKTAKLMGKIGSGQLAKMANQVCIAGILQGLSEALVLAEQSGLDGAALLDVISKGAAGSWQMENRGLTMLAREFDFGFAVDWMRKDLGIVKDQAARLGLSLPVTEMVDGFYSELQGQGYNRADTSSLITRLKKQG